MLVEVGERLVVLIHAAGHWYALDDVCTHDGGPLSEGPLDPQAGTIACPRHGAKFDIRTGAALTMPATKPTKCPRSEDRGRSDLRAAARRLVRVAVCTSRADTN